MKAKSAQGKQYQQKYDYLSIMNTEGRLLCETKNQHSCQVAQKKPEALSFSGKSDYSNSQCTNKTPPNSSSLTLFPLQNKKEGINVKILKSGIKQQQDRREQPNRQQIKHRKNLPLPSLVCYVAQIPKLVFNSAGWLTRMKWTASLGGAKICLVISAGPLLPHNQEQSM